MARRCGDALIAVVGLVDALTDQVRSSATVAGKQAAAAGTSGRAVDRLGRFPVKPRRP